MAVEPTANRWMFVRGVIIQNNMDDLACGDLCLDGIQEADELLMPVALHVAADHRAIEDIKCGEQGGCAIALVIMRHGSGAAL